MNKTMNTICLISIVFYNLITSCSGYKDYSKIPFDEKNPKAWEDPAISQINKDAPHAHFIPCKPLNKPEWKTSGSRPHLFSLNGKWKFHLAQNPRKAILVF